ncbi:MAG: hypothetical protein DWH82_10110 [Planctomycetota bacterium]|nr:MAG: hypothetical protein DWH82_10110 [Planctomycetota bacterium]
MTCLQIRPPPEANPLWAWLEADWRYPMPTAAGFFSQLFLTAGMGMKIFEKDYFPARKGMSGNCRENPLSLLE